jgi:hypothetical protein
MSETKQKPTITQEPEASETTLALPTAGELSPVEPAGQMDGDKPERFAVFANSLLAAEVLEDWGSVLRELHKAYVARIIFYMKPEGGEMTLDEAMNQAGDPNPNESVDKKVDDILRRPVTNISWSSIDTLFRRSPEAAKEVWDLIKNEARNEFESGHRAAEVFERAPWHRDVWSRARYLGIRDSFIEQWQPRGGIELAMIDMLTQSFYLYLYWTGEMNMRTETEMRSDPPQWVQARHAMDSSFPRDCSGMKGYWDPPTVNEQEAVEHASQMADRYSKAFQRNLRSMRDLRRYQMPVTINNPQQVNIAADGGQQMNVTRQRDSGDNG